MILLSFLLFGKSSGQTTFTITSNTNWSAITGGPPTSADNIVVRGGAILTVNVQTAVCNSIQLGGTAGNGAGSLTFSGTNPFVRVTNGVVVGGFGNANRDGTITFTNGSTLDAGSITFCGTGGTPGQGTIVMTAGGTLVTGSIIIGSAGGTWTRGTGSVQLDATNALPSTIFTSFNNLLISSGTTTLGVSIPTLSGNLVVSAGATLALSSYNIGSTAGPANTSINCGAPTGSVISGTGTLTLGGDVNVIDLGTGTNGATISCPVALGSSRTFSVDDDGTAATDLSVSGIISTASGIAKSGAGTMFLSGANSYTGPTTVNEGTLKAGIATQAFGLTSAVIMANTLNAALDITGFNNTIGSLTGGGSTGGNISLGAATLTIGSDNTSTAAYAGIISGTGAITKSGTGLLTLSGSNTYTGLTSINTGTLALGASGGTTNTPLGTTGSGTTVASGAALDLNGFTLGTAEALNLSGTGISNGGALTNSSATSAGYSGLITLGAASSIITNSGDINISNAGTITGAAFGLTLGGTGNGSINSIIGTTSGTLTKSGAGTWTVSGANTFTGLTTISVGVIKLGAAGNATNTPLGTTGSGTTVSSGAVLDLNGFTLGTTEALNISGTGISNGGALSNSSATSAGYSGLITLGAASSIITNSGDINISNAGTITGATFGLTLGGTGNGSISSIIGTTSGTLTKSGAGTWTVSGANTFTGLTTISAGVLKLGAAGNATNTPLGTTGSGTTVSSGAVLDLNGFTLGTTEALNISGTGISNGGVLTNSSSTSSGYSGLITLGASSSIITNSGDLNITNAGTITGATFGLTLGGTGNGSISSIIGTTSGTLTKSGTGAWTVSGASTFTGITTIGAGTLKLGAAGGGTNTPLGTVGSGTTVSLGAALELNGITLGTAEPLTLNGAGVAGGGALVNSSAAGVTYNGAISLGSASSINTNGNITLGSNGISGFNDLTKVGSGTLAMGTGVVSLNGLNISAGTITATSANLNIAGDFINTGTFNHNNGTVNLNGVGSQAIAGVTFYNLTLSNGSTKTLQAAAQVNQTLSLNTGILQLGNYNLYINYNSLTAITGAAFSSSNMISTDGTGYLIKNAASLQALYPVGGGGYYSPVNIAISAGGTTGTISVRAVSTTSLGVNFVKKYWDVLTSVGGKTITATFNYDIFEGNPATSAYFKPTAGTWQTPPPSGTPSFGATSLTITGTTDITSTSTFWTAGMPASYYSYKTGSWSDPTTWTSDPGGTTQVGSTVPGNSDIVEILPGRTVSLPANITSSSLDIIIDGGGALDLSAFQFSAGLHSLAGQGTLIISSSPAVFPNPVVVNTFVLSGGGTTEFRATSNLPVQAIYNNLTINQAGSTITQTIAVLTLNGNLQVKAGTFQINDNTTYQRLKLTVNGDVTVDAGAFIKVGTGRTNSTTSPLSIVGGTAPFIDYYDLQSHRIVLNGNFTNNGTIRFTNLTYPVYNAFPPTSGPTAGFATVYFQGASDNTLYCNGTTDFYNLVLDKGTDQTFKLTVYSSASSYSNFRLFGADNAGGDGGGANPNLKKALWIRTGTLVLQGLVVIPSLSEGTNVVETPAANPSSEYIIPANGALVLDGVDVVVQTTADDYQEVNAAYTLAGGTGLVNGVSQGVGNALGLYGKLEVRNGFLSTKESAGIITTNVASAPGSFILTNGTVDTKQFYSQTGGAASFQQNGGRFILRGRFQRTPTAFTNASYLANAPINIFRANDACLAGASGTFSMNNTTNIFTMTGGAMEIYDVCKNTSPSIALEVNSSPSNMNVTGGTIQFIPTTGTNLADVAIHNVSSTAPFYNLTVNRPSSSTAIQLGTAINVLGDLTLTNCVFSANNLDVTVGGNFTIGSTSIYTSGTNTTTFTGSGSKTFTNNGTINPSLNNWVINKPGDILSLAGSGAFTCSNLLTIAAGTLSDGGNTITINKNISNSGVHTSTGAGEMVLSGGAAQHIVSGSGNGQFGNLKLNDAFGASFSSEQQINGSLTMTTGILDIGIYKLNLVGTLSPDDITSYSTAKMIRMAGNDSDDGLVRTISGNGTVYFPIGTNANAATRYTPAYATLSSVVGTGTLQINVADKELATLAQPAGTALSYYWRARYTGFTGSPTVIYQFTGVDNDDYDGGATPAGYNAAVVPGKVLSSSPYTRSSESTTDISGFKINFNGAGAGFALENASYTAGLPAKFIGTPTVFYTNSNYGTWNTGAIWHQGTKGGATGTVPTTGSIVHIYSDVASNGRVWADGMVTVPAEINFDQDYLPERAPTTENISRLQFRTAGAFNLGNVKGTGMISFGIAGITLSGDFGDFGTNLNSFYLFFAGPASVSNIPVPIPNLMFEYNTSINQNITINEDLILQGNATVVPLQNISINRDLIIGFWEDGNFQFPETGSALTVTVGRNIDYTKDPLASMGNNRDISIQNAVNTVLEHRLIVKGDILNGGNNGWGLTLYNAANRARVTLELAGTGNNSYSRTSTSVPNFYRVVVNKGVDQTSSFTFPQNFTINGPTNASPKALELQNGTLILNSAAFNFALTTGGTNFSIPATSGLNLQSGTLTASGGSGISLNGTLQISGGTLNMAGGDNMIEYSASGNANIVVSNGNLTVGSHIRRSPIAIDGVLRYNQSGGTVIVGASAGPVSNRGIFEVLNTGSDFTFTGGTLTIRRAQTGTPTIASLYLDPATSNIAGGSVINIGDASTPAAQVIGIYSTIPLQTLTINSPSSPVAKMWIGSLTLNGDLNINATAGLNANGLDLILKGNFTNNGTYNFQNNRTIFSGGTQSLSGTSVTNFYDLTVSPVTSLTINNNNTNTVNNDLTLSSGTLICGSNTVNVKGNLINNANYINNSGTGGAVLSGSKLQQISGTGTFGQLELNNAFGASVNNNITLQDNLIMTSGILDINTTLLSLGQSSSIIMNGTPYSSTKMISTDGVWSNVGVLKNFTSPYSGTFIYPIGTGGKYTPVVLTVNSNGHAGSIRVNNINRSHPAVVNANNVLRYYWEVESIGLTGFTGNILLNYLSSDVIGGPESSYVAAHLLTPGINWSKATPGPSTDNVNETNHTITFNFNNSSNLTGEFTAGNDNAIPSTIPQYTSNSDGNWTDQLIWTPSGGTSYPCPVGGPNGFIVTINHIVTANANYCFSYKTYINNKLKAVSPWYGNNFGSVYGTNGTLYVESSSFPAGRYDAFIDCASNNTIEYGGTGTYDVNADLYSNVPNVTFSGTGSRTMPDKDLVICKRLEINGPTLNNSLYNRKLTIQGDIILTSGAFNSGTGANATVSFAGSTLQTLGNFTGTNSLNNLEINNSSGLTLNASVDVSNILMLTNGLITTSGTNKLTVTNTSTSCVIPDGGSSTSYIDGPLIKKLNQGDPSFKYPIGKKDFGLGNKLSIRATQTGTLLWTAEYFNPDTYGTYLAPLTGVNTKEYWAISGVPAGSKAYVEIGWDPVSDLTPLMTQNGLSDMRVAQHDGTDWNEDNSGTTTGSDNYNGSVETNSRATLASGSGNFTIGCVNSPKPRVRMTPAGPVCGTAGIPVSLTSSLVIVAPFTVYYTENGSTKSITPASFPATIPTIASGATYILTGFTYNYPSGTLKTGVVDATPVVVSPVPTTATVGAPISLCGGSSVANLTGNDPVVGSGLWTIISGAGGNVASPTFYNSSFTGTNGSSYTLRWTISSGACTSSADLNISFPLLPVQPGNFTVSSSSVCQGQSGVIFTVPNDPTVTYNWAYSGTGQTITGSTNSVTVNFSASATSGDLSVTATNGCGTSTARSIAITVNPLPAAAGTITGSAAVCQGQTLVAYSVPAIGNATSYTWSYSGVGATVSATTSSVTIDFAANATSGNLTVQGTNACGNGTVSANFAITVDPLPAAAGTITGSAVVCQGQTLVAYSVPAIANATSYTWSYSGTGATISAATSSVTIDFAANATSGNLTVGGTNACGNGTVSANFAITVNPLPAAAGTINGSAAVCQGQTLVAYSVPSIGNATSYTWSYSGVGATVSATTSSVTIDFAANATSGNLTVLGTNACGNGTVSANFAITVNPLPSAAGTITGSAAVCQGQTLVAYSVPSIANATSYTWSYSGTGATISATTSSVTIDFVTNATSGNLTVRGTNACGNGTVSANFAITVNPIPTASISYTGSPWCKNSGVQNVSLTGTSGGTFSAPAGLSLDGATGAIDPSASTVGTYTVTYTIAATGGCGVVTATTVVSISDETWTGLLSTDWNNPGNWSCGLVPVQTTDVRIPNVANKPVLSSGSAGAVNNLIIDGSASLTVTGNSIQVAGTITNSGTFDVTDATVEINGSSGQSLGSGIFNSKKVKNLTINNASGVTLTDTVKVTGIVLVSNGNLSSNGYLVLLSSASGTALISGSGAGSVTGDVTMQRYLPSQYGYKYFSSPFQSAHVSEFGDDMNLGSSSTLFYRYDENRTASGWVNYKVTTNVLNPLTGYAVNFGSSSTPNTVDVTGVVSSGTQSVTLYNHNYTYTKGFNLIGNPYPSPIDWIASGWTKTNIDNAIYLFKASATDQYGGTYASYVNGIQTGGSSLNIIPSMQGFFVHVSDGSYPVTGTLAMDNSVRVNNLNQPFASKALKMTNDVSIPLIRLSARYSDDATSVDPMVIYFDNAGTPDFDSQLDALKLLNTDLKVPNLSTVCSNGTLLSINAMPAINGDLYTIPLGLKLNRTGTLTAVIKINDLDPSLAGYNIYLTDVVAGTQQDLSGANQFSVTLPKGEYNNRFFLNFVNVTTGLPEINPKEDVFSLYSFMGKIRTTIFKLMDDKGVISVYNISGQKVYMENVYDTGYHEFDPGLKDGIYIVNFTTGSFRVTKKLFIKN